MIHKALDFVALRTIDWPIWMPGARSAARDSFDEGVYPDWETAPPNPHILPWRRYWWHHEFWEGASK